MSPSSLAPYLDLCIVDGQAAVGSLDADPYTVLYRDIVPPSLLRETSGAAFRADGAGPTACLVQGLPWWANDMSMEQALAALEIGDVGNIRFQEHPVSGKSKGVCLIRFHSAASAKACSERLSSFGDEYGEHSVTVALVDDDEVARHNTAAPLAKGGDRGFGLERAPLPQVPQGMLIPGMMPGAVGDSTIPQPHTDMSRVLLDKLRETLTTGAGGASQTAMRELARQRGVASGPLGPPPSALAEQFELAKSLKRPGFPGGGGEPEAKRGNY